MHGSRARTHALRHAPIMTSLLANVNIAYGACHACLQMPNLCVHASIYGLHAIVNDANIVLKRIKPLYIVLLINPTV